MSKWYFLPVSDSDVIFAVITITILALVSVSYVWVLINLDALKALVEAEATILGFFGIVAVYWLTSIDSRIDRLEQEKHDYEIRKRQAEANLQNPRKTDTVFASEISSLKDVVTNLENRIENNQTLKKGVTDEASIIGILLVISLVASIGLIGFQSTYADVLKNLNFDNLFVRLSFVALAIPMMLFLESIWFIFSLLRRMSRKPKTEQRARVAR